MTAPRPSPSDPAVNQQLRRRIARLERRQVKVWAWLSFVSFVVAFCLPGLPSKRLVESETTSVFIFGLPSLAFAEARGPDATFAVIMGLGLMVWIGVVLIGAAAILALPTPPRWWQTAGLAGAWIGMVTQWLVAIGYLQVPSNTWSEVVGPELVVLTVACVLAAVARYVSADVADDPFTT